ncbi:YcxB family protein [Dysgonomonas sp. 25]|nr:YcxB family protein [Dysgonomonas sp. 25]
MLELNYTLDKDDYIQFQLYIFSISPIMKKQRRTGRFILLGILLILGILFIPFNPFISYYFWGMAVLAFLLFPLYSRWFYKRTLRKNTERNYDSENSTISFKISDETIESSNKIGHTTMYLKELLSIIELADYFYIQQSKQVYYIIPKKKIADPEGFKSHLLNCSRALQIPYLLELDWKWR